MTGHGRALLNLALRCDLSTFIGRTFLHANPGQRYLHNWHIHAIAHHLELCATGRIKRLIITVPPRSLKSICASVAYPAWVLGHDPTRRIICVSYAQELSLDLARKSRDVLTSNWYPIIFPHTRLVRDTEAEQATTQGGSRLATSIGGTLTGKGGNIIIIDDPHKPEEASSRTSRARVLEWYRSTLSSRLDDPADDVIIVVMQRLHMDDLVGHLLEEGGWTHLDLPAIAVGDEEIPIGANLVHHRAPGDLLDPRRLTQATLDELRRKLGHFNFEAQYQQTPIPERGNLIKWDWFQTFEGEPHQRSGDEIVQSWDTAAKSGELNDYSVCTTWLKHGNIYYLLDVLRRKMDYPTLKRTAIGHASAWKAKTVLIEDTVTGTALIQDLREDRSSHAFSIIAVRPEGDKVMRMSAQSAKIEGARVFLPERAAWLDEFRTELLAFPDGRHDDQVDSMSQFLEWASTRKTVLFG